MSRTVALWFGVAAAPTAWTLHLVAGYGYEEIVCSPGTAEQDLWGVGVVPFVAVLTAAMAALAVAGGVAAWSTWGAARRRDVPDPRGRIAFTGFASLLSSALFLLLIVLGGVQLAAFGSCDP